MLKNYNPWLRLLMLFCAQAINVPHKEESKSQDEIRELTARVIELEATSKRLRKRFEIHCNDFLSDVIEMAALSRPLSLGMLYDSQRNSFCQDIFMWDEDTLARMKVSLPRPQTYVKVLENDSPQERFRVLEMSPVLQSGTQTGQIKMTGAAAFLIHPEQHQERATLHYRTTTRLDMISQRLLQEVAPSALVGQTTATHVVSAVYFGAQAFMVFESDSSNHEKNAEIVDVLKIMTSTFCPNHIISSLNASEKAKSSLLACSLYIDVGDWKSPVSFDKAVEIYGSLPTLLGSKDERAVPLKVWLYPLKKLNKSSVHAALSGVSENVMQRAESILEHLRKQIRICQDIIKDYINVNVIMQFLTLEDKLVEFLELMQEYQTTFQKEIADIVHIKEGKRERSLQDLLKRHSQSPFSAEKTNQWLENKETELKILNDFRAADITVVKSQAELQQIISHSQKTRVMCLTLYSPDVEDSFITALRQYIESDGSIQNDSLLFKPVSIDDKKIIKAQLFIAANEDAEQTKFIAALVPSDDFPEYSVQFYRDGRIVSRNVNLGTKSDLVQISHIKHISVSLKLNQSDTKRIERYIVEYRALGDDGSNNEPWKQIIFDGPSIRETCMISDLKSGHKFQLRYIFVEQDCMNLSRIMNFQTVVTATPGKLLVNKLDRDTLRVTWLRAETDQDFPVLWYNVEYKEAGLEGWSSVQTEGLECECTLTVLHSTCYRVRVSAVYEDITSKPSEETPVPVDVWNINLSKRKSSILLEVLKLQTEKKPVELIDWTDEESEVKGFLQCLPYISQLRFDRFVYYKKQSSFQFLVNLTVAASKFETTGQNYTELFTSVCSYTSFPFSENVPNHQCDFLLDLWSHVKDYESQTGRSVLPTLQPIYQSAPAVWRIKLSERKSSILLEVLKLQTEKKPVDLIDCTDEESTLRGFFQCLPYISQLRFPHQQKGSSNETEIKKRLLALNLSFEVPTLPKEMIELSMEALFSYMYYGKWDFLLDLYSHVKDYETRTGRSVLPAFHPVYQSAPAVWSIDLSERKSSILLEVLKLQTEKKPVELRDWTDEESEVKGFLQCLPYISQLRFNVCSFNDEKQKTAVQFLVNLSVAASECDEATGESFTMLLISVCSYTSFPCANNNCDNFEHGYVECQIKHSDFLLDLYSHMKNYQIKTGRSVLPALKSIYQSVPAVWRIKLSERKSSILLEVLKLQTEKKPVELIDWTDEESEVKGFLQCLPYISQLRFDSLIFKEKKRSVQFLLNLIISASEFDKMTGENYTELFTSVCSYTSFPFSENYTNPHVDQCDFLLDLCSHVKDYESQTDRSVLPALQPIYQSAPAVWSIKLSERKSSILLEVLKLQTEKKPVELRDCTDEESEVKGFLPCLPYISQLRLSKDALQQLVSVVYEAQDDELTRCFLKVSEDLTSCSLTWEVIHYLLQHQALNFKLDFRKSKTSCENIRELLPVLDRIQLKRLSPSFTLSIIMEIYETRFPQYVSSLMSSIGNDINLNARVLDSVRCAALRFTLEHCNTVKLNLLWTSIPEEELESFLPLLSRVKQLSVDRLLLLKLLHCCSSSDLQQEAAHVLLSALHNTLDFSCCSALDLTDTQENQEHLKLTEKDCRIISSVLQKTQSIVKLILQDCELSDTALKQLWPILPQVQLSCSKALLLQFLACISKDGSQRGSLRSAEALSQALGGEMDLSHTQLDPRVCEQLALFLEYSEGLTELDLSHCKLTDLCMKPLLPHLHKTQTLDLSHNTITDESAKRIHSVVCTHSNIQTVRLFRNKISDRKQFIGDKRFEIW
uniref:Si:ch211-281l24.3 n=1 Tax=Sinocyclocheilus rhinocerous TaxID=307959 RepID=A0A673M3D7_9TELE